MAGIYIHIPFCQKRCSYCDFYSQTNLSLKKEYVSALCKEIKLRKNYLEQATISTLYFGGGTPSLLDKDDFCEIFACLNSHFDLSYLHEVTLEANPDDLNQSFFDTLNQFPFNRLSIGIQSFDNGDLKLMNRRHSAEKAMEAIYLAKENGFHNISIDLIYGLPNQTLEKWQKNLEQALSLDIQHISAYHLTYEEGTILDSLLRQKKIQEVKEEDSLAMFEMLMALLTKSGFEHYEISNFAKKNFYSQHNSSYWSGEKYLGLGASAHSFDEKTRQWNISSIEKYNQAVSHSLPFYEMETLSEKEKYNEFIITSLRTKKGIDLTLLEKKFGKEMLNYCIQNCQTHINNNRLCLKHNFVTLTQTGIFVSDKLIEDLICI